MSFSKTFLAAALGALALMTGAAQAADKTIVVGYQTDALPSSVGIANGDFEKATGAKIDFRRFNSGAEIFAAIASGDVQVGYVGSSPFAAATSRAWMSRLSISPQSRASTRPSSCATARGSTRSPT
jgi:taurine transport system substrate-binding protein